MNNNATNFGLCDEGEVGDFLGIRIEKSNHNSFTLSQTGSIDKVLKTSKMEYSNTAKTPAATTPLCVDKEGELFGEEWDYATIVVMLMFLSINSRPDIHAVNQCARFTMSKKYSCNWQTYPAVFKRYSYKRYENFPTQ